MIAPKKICSAKRKQDAKGKGHGPTLAGQGSTPEVPDIYKLRGKNVYYMHRDGAYIPLSLTELQIKLEAEFVKLAREDRLPLINAAIDAGVDWAGTLAGHKAGLELRQNGDRVLITRTSGMWIEPTDGENYHTIVDYVARLLSKEQALLFHAWLKLSRAALKHGDYSKFITLIIAGAFDTGKSILAEHVIRPAFDGTMADPYSHLTGQTSFNSDLFIACLLLADDKGNNPRIESRRNLMNTIKQFSSAAGDSRCEGKGKDAQMLDPFWRVVILLNNSEKCLQALPEMDQELLDKIMMLEVQGRGVNVPTKTDEERAAFRQSFRDSLSDYFGWLERLKIPDMLLSDRFGLAAWQHPHLLEKVRETSLETLILNTVTDNWDQIIQLEFDQKLPESKRRFRPASDKSSFQVTCGMLYSILTDTDFPVADKVTAKNITKHFDTPGRFGLYVESLSRTNARVSKVLASGGQHIRVAGGGKPLYRFKA